MPVIGAGLTYAAVAVCSREAKGEEIMEWLQGKLEDAVKDTIIAKIRARFEEKGVEPLGGTAGDFLDEAYIVAALQEKVAQRPVTYGELATIPDGAVWWERMGYPDARAQLKELDPDADFSVAKSSSS